MSNPQDLKQAVLKVLAEKGDYSTILKHLSGEEKEEKETKRLNRLIEPLSEFAELMTANTKGVLMENMDKKLSKSTREALSELASQVNGAIDALQGELKKTIASTKTELTAEHLTRLADAKGELESKLLTLALEVVTEKAASLLPELKESGRLTPEEIDGIVHAAALSVESQVSNLIGDYLAEYPLSVEQITGFSDAVRKLLPPDRQVSWNEIVGKPDISQGGTNTNLVRQMIDTALASFTGGASTLGELTDVHVPTPANNEVLTYNASEERWESVAPPGASGGEANTASNLGTGEGVFGAKVGVDLRFKSIVAGTNVTLASDANEVTVNATAQTEEDFTTTLKNKLDGIAASANNYVHPNHSGDVTSAGDGATTIANDAVTNAKLANVATSTIKGRVTAATGDPEDLTATQVRTLINVADGATANQTDAHLLERANHTGTQAASTISDFQATVSANADVTANTAKVTNATHTGDVTGATELTIANSAVTLAKMANLAQDQFIGRTTASTGVPQTATITAAARTVLDDATVAAMVDTLGGATSTGTGGIARATSPTFVTPTLGAASATSLVTTGAIELGHASDTTLSRSAAGILAVEGVVIPSISSTNTLTNKRVTSRTGTVVSAANPTINTDNVDHFYITGQTEAIASFTTNLSGTRVKGDMLFISVIGTAARGITWGASFANGPVALPTTTVTTTELSVLFRWDGTVFRCMASGSTV